jgi:cytochrome c peroxidase
MKLKEMLYIGLLGFTFMSCADDGGIFTGEDDDVNVIENPGNIQEIAALPLTVNYPDDNGQSQAKEDLGRMLFWDPVLSGAMDVSCATCHHPDFAYADGLERSIGVGGNGLGPDRIGGTLIDRNSPTILNTANNGIELTDDYDPTQAPMFWDNRATGLEEQSIGPILSGVEMRGVEIPEDEIVELVINRLEAIPNYVDLFESAFGNEQITENRIAAAISTFERSLLANTSRFDQYMRGDEDILTQQELAGLDDFIAVGCADCHSGAMLSDYDLHTLSVPNNGVNDLGANGIYDFRTPTLRNVALTAPYMHNGVFESLDDVLDFYRDISRGNGNSQNNNVNNNQIANEARNLNLNNNQIDDIVAFLNTLTDTDFDRIIPDSVPSNLQVGRNL